MSTDPLCGYHIIATAIATYAMTHTTRTKMNAGWKRRATEATALLFIVWITTGVQIVLH